MTSFQPKGLMPLNHCQIGCGILESQKGGRERGVHHCTCQKPFSIRVQTLDTSPRRIGFFRVGVLVANQGAEESTIILELGVN